MIRATINVVMYTMTGKGDVFASYGVILASQWVRYMVGQEDTVTQGDNGIMLVRAGQGCILTIAGNGFLLTRDGQGEELTRAEH